MRQDIKFFLYSISEIYNSKKLGIYDKDNKQIDTHYSEENAIALKKLHKDKITFYVGISAKIPCDEDNITAYLKEDRDMPAEFIHHTFHMRLWKYIKVDKMDTSFLQKNPTPGEKYYYCSTSIRWDKILKDFPGFAEKVNKTSVRVLKYVGEPQLMLFRENITNANYNGVFVKVDEETSFGGNYTFDNVDYCGIRAEEVKVDAPFYFDVEKEWNYWVLPYPTRQRLESEGITQNIMHKMSGEDRHRMFQTFNPKEKWEIMQKFFNQWFIDSVNSGEGYLPFRVYLHGNDDASYSRWFGTVEEMNEELGYLAKMQPINMWKDVQGRGYVFTN
jgi:hypothetical protein